MSSLIFLHLDEQCAEAFSHPLRSWYTTGLCHGGSYFWLVPSLVVHKITQTITFADMMILSFVRPQVVKSGLYARGVILEEWNCYARDNLEIFIFKRIREHFSKNGEMKGAVTTIGEITTKIEYWNLKLWLKKVSDTGTYPDSTDYFWMLLDWRPCPDEILIQMPPFASAAHS